MNEKLEYAEMLEIPVNTCNITYKPSKNKNKKKLVKLEEAKEKLLKKINNNVEKEPLSAPTYEIPNTVEEPTIENVSASEDVAEKENNEVSSVSIERVKAKKQKRGISVIGVQVAIIAVLLAIIVVSNVFWTDSGINVLMRNVFGGNGKPVEKVLEYNEFEVDLSKIESEITLENGVMTFSHKGSIYTPCDGTITSITEDAGKYILEITHNQNFKTVLSGIDYAYCTIGDKVLSNVPVGYSLDNDISMCFYSQEELITDYDLENNQLVWQV